MLFFFFDGKELQCCWFTLCLAPANRNGTNHPSWELRNEVCVFYFNYFFYSKLGLNQNKMIT